MNFDAVLVALEVVNRVESQSRQKLAEFSQK